MDFQMWRSLTRQRVYENRYIVDAGLVLFMVWGFAQRLLGKPRRAFYALSRVHRTTRSPWMRKVVEPYLIAHRSAVYTEPRPMTEPDLKSYFGNRLIVLKPPAPGGEKGVVFAMVSVMFSLLHANMDLGRLFADYTVVFEPSWSGYCLPEILEFTRWTDEVFILSAEENDFAFLKRLESNLIPVNLGPCDWVDPRAAEPYLTNPKEFDIMMNSNWGAWKRHHVLFRMLKHAKRRYRVVLIGQADGRTQSELERLANFFGVAAQLTIFENIPYEQVMDLTGRSRVSVLLSLKEGSNRAISESIFCDLPVIVLANHVGGIRKNVVPETGLLAEEEHLESAVERLLTNRSLRPREWGLEHISCFKSTERLNTVLRDRALQQGKPWTQDIAVRSNSPESTYSFHQDAERLRPWNAKLKDYLR